MQVNTVFLSLFHFATHSEKKVGKDSGPRLASLLALLATT